MNIAVIGEGADLIEREAKGSPRIERTIKGSRITGYSVSGRIIVRPGYPGAYLDC